MKEVWIKKTVYRRYLVDDHELKAVKLIIEHEPERAEELIGDIYDKNSEVEYDEEKIVLPIEHSISEG